MSVVGISLALAAANAADPILFGVEPSLRGAVAVSCYRLARAPAIVFAGVAH